MDKKQLIAEELTKAVDSLEFARGELAKALEHSSSVASVILLPLIRRAAELQTAVKLFARCLRDDQE